MTAIMDSSAGTVGALAPEDFRSVMSYVPTGVAVVTAMTREGPVGLTVGTFLSVSLDPPLIGFLPARSSSTWPVIAPIGKFCVNVLADESESVCRSFAKSGGDKFEGLDWELSATGSPVLADALVWFDCQYEHSYPAGDHLFVLGRVMDLAVNGGGSPLVFFHGGFRRLTNNA